MSKQFANSVLISGANRGLGLQFVKILASQVGTLFAGCRKPADAQELNELAKNHNNIHVVQLDVADETSIKSCFEAVTKICGKTGLSCLINNSGRNNKPDTELSGLSLDKFNDVFSVNTFGLAIVSKTFLPLVKQAAENPTVENIIPKAIIVNISSQLSSVELLNKESLKYYTYRMSKASLNMLTKIMALELENNGIDVVGLHPGWVKTDMGGPNGELTVEKSIDSMLAVLSSLKRENNGCLLGLNGEKLPY